MDMEILLDAAAVDREGELFIGYSRWKPRRLGRGGKRAFLALWG